MSYQLPNRASDGGPAYETFRTSDDRQQCGSCRAYTEQLSPCTWDTSLAVCSDCAPELEAAAISEADLATGFELVMGGNAALAQAWIDRHGLSAHMRASAPRRSEVA